VSAVGTTLGTVFRSPEDLRSGGCWMDLSRTRASPLDGTALSYKTNDRSVDDRDVSEGPVHEVEPRQGSLRGPHSASLTVAPRRQGSIMMSRTCD
jgi:hypothetical protein